MSMTFVDSIIVMETIAMIIWDSRKSFDFPFPSLHFDNEEDPSYVLSA